MQQDVAELVHKENIRTESINRVSSIHHSHKVGVFIGVCLSYLQLCYIEFDYHNPQRYTESIRFICTVGPYD